MDYVRIITPGDQFTIGQPVNEGAQARFPHQWNQFYSPASLVMDDERHAAVRMDAAVTGSGADAERAELLHRREHRHASDQQINNIGMAGGMSGYVLRAVWHVAYLTRAKEHAQDGRMVAELQSVMTSSQRWRPSLRRPCKRLSKKSEKRPGRPRMES